MAVNWTALSIVIVDPSGHLAAMQKSILRGAGVRNINLVETSAALQQDLVIGRDIVPLNWISPTDDFVDVIRAVRARNTSADPFVSVILIAALKQSGRFKAALEAGANSCIALPFRAADITRHIAHVADVSIPFVDTPGYFGPDRRRRADPLYAGAERRTSAATLLAGDDLARERQRMRQTAMSALEVKVALTQ